MFGLISAGVSLAGLGMSAVQAIQQGRKEKAAKAESQAAVNAFKNISEQNPYASVQVPTLGFELAQQGIDRSTTSALSAAQGAGAEGVIGAAGNIVQAGAEAELNLAAQAADAEFARDAAEAGAQSGINQRKAQREGDLAGYQLSQANIDATNASENKANAISGMFDSAIGGISGLDSEFDVYEKLRKRKKSSGTSAPVIPTVTPQ